LIPPVLNLRKDNQSFAPMRKDRFAGKKFAEDDPDLANGFERAVLAEKLRARGQVLPAKQPVHELRRGNGLDLFPELSERQPVDARNQPALASLGLSQGRIAELASHHDAARLKLQQSLLPSHAERERTHPSWFAVTGPEREIHPV